MSDIIEKEILGNVSFINMGQSPDSIYYNEEGFGLPLIQGNADIKERKTIKRFWTTQFTKICDEDDIILTVRAPVGYVGLATFKSCIGRGVCSIKPVGVEPKYLYYLLIFNEENWKTFEAGTTFNAVTSKEVFNFPLRIIKSTAEQYHIAHILSTCDAVIEKTQSAIAKYKAIKQGMLHDLFTRGIDVNTGKLRPGYEDAPELYKESILGRIPGEWETEIFSNAFEIISGGTPSTQNKDYWNGQIPWLSVEDFNNGKRYVQTAVKNITEEGLNNSATNLLEKGMIIISARGTVGVISQLGTTMAFNQSCYGINSICKKANNDFVYYFLNYYKNYFGFISFGSVFNTITREYFDEMEIYFPSNEDELAEIIKRMSLIDSTIESEQSYLQKMQLLKKGLMEDLLSGRKKCPDH